MPPRSIAIYGLSVANLKRVPSGSHRMYYGLGAEHMFLIYPSPEITRNRGTQLMCWDSRVRTPRRYIRTL